MLNTYLSTRNFYVPEWKKRFLSVIENKKRFFSLSIPRPTLKSTALLKDKVLTSGMNFILNSRNGKTKKNNKSLKSNSNYHHLEVFKKN